MKYRITGSRNTLEHFWHGGKYYRIQFDAEGFAYTEEDAVAEHYKMREPVGYVVLKMAE